VYYIVSGASVWVRGSISANKDIAQRYFLTTANNREVDFAGTYLIAGTTPNLVASYQSGTVVGDGSDDSTPIYTNNVGHIMEGHGLEVPVVTSVGHNKTSADLGSVWSNGGHQFVIAEISGDAITLYSKPYASGSTWAMAPAVSGTLAHVSGAAHTGNISITSCATAQKYPVVKNLVRRVLADGTVELVDGNSGRASYVDISEEFDVIDPSTIVTTNRPFDWNDAAGLWMHVKNVYRATAGTTIVHSTYDVLRPLDVGYIGIIQVAAITIPTYEQQYYYIPRTKPVDGYDFKAIQLFNSVPARPIYFTSTYVDDVDNPPDRQVFLFKKAADDNYDIGLAFGYSPYGDTAARNRDCASSGLGYCRINESKKTFMAMVAGIGVVDRVTYDAYAYRQYIDPKQYDSGKLAYWNTQNGHDLVYVDYHRRATNDVTVLPSRLAGKAVRVIDAVNIQTPAARVSADGSLILSTTGNSTYGYAVLELTAAPVRSHERIPRALPPRSDR
jgi:hypothetical protein